MSNKIKNLMAGGRSRLEKRVKKKSKAAEDAAVAAPVEKSEPQETLTQQPVVENISVTTVQPAPQVDEPAEQALQIPDKPPVEPLPQVEPEVPPSNSFSQDNLTPQMRDSLRILLNSNITLECLQAIESMSNKNKDFMAAFLKLGPQSMEVFCNIAKDEDYVITTKIKLIALLNRVSRNEIVHKLLRRVGAAIEALRRLKELLLLQ
ncbi:hypothetical protein [Candidatus Magnetominusculus xianensis]|uniref:Uncharacterized protein n=1 Tax=Candidatus Magnetominusculus xianensis TaxID=1748249 RepID=A0ABR5SH67_9BACT|nr:hypothetical protein [Candidatus Magnetominusculus xianensis]KWT82474.1 hypothetical protein ASN18_2506 [Candidatus Magnetominusculus xianensis]MBF0403194.1 hypothetical protein [Nitrospirota bacterium]